MVHEIPGHHMNMLDEPHVQVLAAELQMALDEARAQAAEPHGYPHNPCDPIDHREPSTAPDPDGATCERTPIRRA